MPSRTSKNLQLPLFAPEPGWAPIPPTPAYTTPRRVLPSWLESLGVILLVIGFGFAWVGFESHRLGDPKAPALHGSLTPSVLSSPRFGTPPIRRTGTIAEDTASDGTAPRPADGSGLVGRRV